MIKNKSNLVLKNSIYLIGSRIIDKILFFGLIIFISRFLGVEGLGNYSYIMALIFILFSFSELGLGHLTVRNIARNKKLTPKYLGNMVPLRIISAFIVFLILIVYSIIAVDSNLRIIIILSGFLIFLISIISLLYSVFQAYEKMQYEAFLTISKAFISAGIGIIFLVNNGGVFEVIIALLIGHIIALLFGFYIIYKKFEKPRFEINFSTWKKLINKGIYFWIHCILIFAILKVNVLMLYHFKGDLITGLYSAAEGITQNLTILLGLVIVSIYPKFSRLWVTSKKNLISVYKNSVFYLISLALVVGLFLLFFSNTIIILFYGSEFGDSILLLKLLLIPSLFFLLNGLNSHYLFAVNKQRENIIFLFTAIVLNVILNLLLIPGLSMLGVVIAFTISQSVAYVFRQIYIIRFNKIMRHNE